MLWTPMNHSGEKYLSYDGVEFLKKYTDEDALQGIKILLHSHSIDVLLPHLPTGSKAGTDGYVKPIEYLCSDIYYGC